MQKREPRRQRLDQAVAAAQRVGLGLCKMARWLGLSLAICLVLASSETAAATPRLCQPGDDGGYSSSANQPRPNGVDVAYLLVKTGRGQWVEPPSASVCVDVTFYDQSPANRYLEVHLWSTAGFFLDLGTAGLPQGTPVALGLA